MKKHVLGAALALALGLSLAACSGGTPTSGAATTAGPTSSTSGSVTASSPAPAGSATDHNDVDVMFVTMMVPHHQGAVEMADLALAQASSQPVKELAARIQAAQGPEIEQMQGWLAAWGAATPTTNASAEMGGDMGHDMGRMMQMSEADMAALRAATGVEFDKLFLQQMIAHHQGAIDMAQVEIAQGQYPPTLALAQAIRTSQTAEIAEMQQLLPTL